MKQAISVELDLVTKDFQGKRVFSEISVLAKPGECLVITGCNGSGKSTLLKIIAGVVRPTHGVVNFIAGDQKIPGNQRLDYLGFVSPEVVMYNALTGYENVEFLLEVRGLDASHQLLKECLERVGLGIYGGNAVRTYSTGMRQRLKFAVLLALNPAVWLLDEPSSNLDDDGKRLVQELIQSGQERDVTILLATNENAEACYADKIVSLA